MNVASSNLANVSTTQTPGRRGRIGAKTSSWLPSRWTRRVHSPRRFAASRSVELSKTRGRRASNTTPGHPDADAEGYVELPNVNVVREMVDMITASRAYEAGITAMSTAVSMAERALGIG